MISDPVIAKHYHKVQRTLKSTHNKNKARDRVMEEGISEIEASKIVDYVFNDNVNANRKLGIYYLIGAGAVTLLLLIIWSFTDRLYYIALPIAAIAAIMGFFQMLLPSGYSVIIPTESESERLIISRSGLTNRCTGAGHVRFFLFPITVSPAP